MKNTTLALFVTLSVVLFACKDDESNEPTPNDNNNSIDLVGTSWMHTHLSVDPPMDLFGVPISDFYAQLESCEQDNLTQFQADSTYIWDEGETKCDPSDPQINDYGTWILSPDKKKITIDDEVWDVDVMTSTNMTWSSTFTEDSVEYTFTAKLIKK